jgi:L-fuconolactonase
MVTEADWHTWSDEVLAPYIDTVLEAFTPKRLMFGSDWPLVTLASSYQKWVGTVRAAIAQLSTDERDWILAKAATEAYGLATA